jgi:hypothetical protein
MLASVFACFNALVSTSGANPSRVTGAYASPAIHGTLPAVRAGTGQVRKNLACPPCPPPLLFVSQHLANRIGIFADPFANAIPPNSWICDISGAASQLNNPQGMFVNGKLLYVANTGGHNVLVFKICHTRPSRIFTDTVLGVDQLPTDVAVSSSGYTYVSNYYNTSSLLPSVSVYAPNQFNNPSQLTVPSAVQGAGITIDSLGNCFWAYIDSLHVGHIWEFPNVAGVCVAPGGFEVFPTGGPHLPLVQPVGIEMDFVLDDLIINDSGPGTTETYTQDAPFSATYDWTNPPGANDGPSSHLSYLRLRQNEKILNVANDFAGEVLRYKYPAYTALPPLTDPHLDAHTLGVATYPAPPL